MGAKTALSEERYLHTSFPDLDKEYRNGELVERTLPDYLHGKTQLLIAAFFAALRNKHSLYGCTETRMKLRAGIYRIPDVAVFRDAEPGGRVPETPPFIAIEILSPDDRLVEVREKLEEYRSWGVPNVWLVDPHARKFFTFEHDLAEVTALTIPELHIELTSADVFQ
jgi:Uma2 family endonuclease